MPQLFHRTRAMATANLAEHDPEKAAPGLDPASRVGQIGLQQHLEREGDST
jgi:hypothetical protein